MTVSELSKFFKQKRLSEDSFNLDKTKSQSQQKHKSILNNANPLRLSKKTPVETANKRYAASQASTYFGGVVTGLHTRDIQRLLS